jgi:hypothetical protein
VRPFAGPAGRDLLTAAEHGAFEEGAQLAQRLVNQALAAEKSPLLVCDRHWMTVFTLLPEPYWEAWLPLPPTTLCWANLDTTLARLAQRRDDDPESEAYHRHYLDRYWELGQRFSSHLLRTDLFCEEACVTQLVAWAGPYVGAATSTP